MIYKKGKDITTCHFEIFEDFGFITACSTMRHGGVSTGEVIGLNLGINTLDSDKNVAQNLRIVCEQLDINIKNIITPVQTHSNNIVIVDKKFLDGSNLQRNQKLSSCDALVTNIPGITLTIRTADCVPVFFVDPRQKVVALAHAGWRGTVLGIAPNTVELMAQQYNCNPEDILVAFGPCISKEQYETGYDVVKEIEKLKLDLSAICETLPKEKWLVDLVEINRQLLQNSGILKNHFTFSNECTFSQDSDYYSYRREKNLAGRILSLILIK